MRVVDTRDTETIGRWVTFRPDPDAYEPYRNKRCQVVERIVQHEEEAFVVKFADGLHMVAFPFELDWTVRSTKKKGPS